MSHSKERQEKICLNCGTALTGRYCQNCGQENIEPKETVWGLVSHFFNDITHFDGKFFSTVKYLITRPGFLSAAYIKGQRASYLHPIRMYVFTSAFFFIVFFSVFNPQHLIADEPNGKESYQALLEGAKDLRSRMATTKDTVLSAAMQRSLNHIDAHAAVIANELEQARQNDSIKLLRNRIRLDSISKKPKGNKFIAAGLVDSLGKAGTANQINVYSNLNNGTKFDYHSALAYDSVQKELAEDKRDSWIANALQHKVILLKAKSSNNKKEALALLAEKFMHTMPQALFVSLPFFALILLMLYARRPFFYVDHGIFAIHLYCATFIFLLAYFAIDKLKTISGWNWLIAIEVVLSLGIFFYLYKAMRRFYRQGRLKTITKFIILNFLSLMVVSLLITIFLFLSLIQFS